VQLRRIILVIFLSGLPFITGCASYSSNGRGVSLPNKDRVTKAVWDAARSPDVWLPAAGAVVLQIDNADERISDWAREEHLVFGSQESAQDWSNAGVDMGEAANLIARGLSVAERPTGWQQAALGYGADVLATQATRRSTGFIKEKTNRTRPNGTNRESFPSGHASKATAHSRSAALTLSESAWLGDGAPIWHGLATANSLMTGWARVEAGYHYPADAMAGIALGNFMVRAIRGSFVDLPPDEGPLVGFSPNEAWVGWGARF